MTEDKIETSKVMVDFLAGVGFGVPCSESCSEYSDVAFDKIILFTEIAAEKLAK